VLHSIEISGEKVCFLLRVLHSGLFSGTISKRQSVIATYRAEGGAKVSDLQIECGPELFDFRSGLVLACGMASFPSLTVDSVFYRIPIQIEMRPNAKDDDI
jgi:hypothetical protein